MTTAGAVALAVSYKYLGKDFKSQKRFQDALRWLGQTFTVTANPGTENDKFHAMFTYYYLYGIERVGAFADIQKLGSHDWYAEGANHLVSSQKGDGSWNVSNSGLIVVDTAFAILFLRRATQHMIDTGEKFIDSGSGSK